MTVPIAVRRLFAFFDNIWSFILTLVRSLLALFSFRRRHSSDPFTLPSINRAPKDALARAQTRLRPILLTPRSIARTPGHYQQRALSTRSGSATSTLFPGRHENVVSGSGPARQPSHPGPQRTSPKLDLANAKLDLSAAAPVADNHACPTDTISSREGTPDTDTSLPTTHTTSLSMQPLTPPDRCYLGPIPSMIDCPYTEPWPADGDALDRDSKARLPASPLRASSVNTDLAFPQPIIGPIGSPPPAHWSPSQVWADTPCGDDDGPVPDPALGLSFDPHAQSPLEPSSALVNISHALISRSHGSIKPYDEASPAESSDPSLFVNASNEPATGTLQPPDPTTREDEAPTHDNQHYVQFHRPEAYVRAWRLPGRLPGKSNRAPYHGPTTTRSCSHPSLPAVCEWYSADAYAPSPTSVLSPPRGESATEDEDEDEVPLGRLQERISYARARHSLAVPLDMGKGLRRATAMSPQSRRMSEGCLLAISESTPTRVGIGARPRRSVASIMALDEEVACGYKDWLEALSLRYPSEQKDTVAPGLESRVAAEVAACSTAA